MVCGMLPKHLHLGAVVLQEKACLQTIWPLTDSLPSEGFFAFKVVNKFSFDFMRHAPGDLRGG